MRARDWNLTLALLLSIGSIFSLKSVAFGEDYPIRLERAAPYEVANEFVARMSYQLDKCFSDYKVAFNDPNAQLITRENVKKFTSINSTSEKDCTESFDLKKIVPEILDEQKSDGASPEILTQWLLLWSLQNLKAATVDGYVQLTNLPMYFYYDLLKVRDQNAMIREKNPTDVDLALIRKQWALVTSRRGNLDNDYLNPVIFSPEVLSDKRIFAAMETEFNLGHLRLVSTGKQAVSDFWQVDEGPGGIKEFKFIAEQFEKPSIKKRFFFAGSGKNWSDHVLIVVDELDQAYGLRMGYSE